MSYGDHILATGAEIANWENIFGAFLYETRFAGRAPILDIGPGRAWFTRQSPTNIVAVDLEEALVSAYAAQGLEVRQGSIENLPFEDNLFEGVFCCWLLEHLPDPSIGMREVRRVMAPGAYGCFIVPEARTLMSGFYDDLTHVRPFTRPSLEQLARLSGFKRFRVQDLFWTRGVRRLQPFIGDRGTLRLLAALDSFGRMMGITNGNNLMFEFWK